MADGDEEDLQMAIRMSLHGSPLGAKRSKPIEESLEARERSLQRELRAAAAERRMAMMTSGLGEATVSPRANTAESKTVCIGDERIGESSGQVVGDKLENEKKELPSAVVEQLFSMMFGGDVSAGILSRWSNQGIRFSSDHETSVGLVQHEGGPCGVLAAIQAFLLKYLIFLPEDSGTQGSGQKHLTSKPSSVDDLVDMPEDRKERALIHGMVEILFLCGNKERAAVATLNVSEGYLGDDSNSLQRDEAISREFHGLIIESASDLQKVLKVKIFTSELGTFNWLRIELPVFRSRLGAMLFLISALLSHGLDSVQDDRDDPSLPLVTAPFGHASQEIVNLLLCGRAVPNVFDGRMDLGGGMSLKGIPGPVEVGFLTLLESLNFCKVGQHLKHPKWPIWVVGSESHYTVLFALDSSVQDENDLEQRVSRIRRAFDAQDQSGGGGFISTDGFHKVLCEMGISLPSEKLNSLCSSGYIVWSELWQVLLDLDKDCGGLKDSSILGKKQFDVYHFNGIAKSILNGSQVPAGETPIQRPRLSKISVVVPPSWVQDLLVETSISDKCAASDSKLIANQLHEPSRHAPLVDCIRTCWQHAICWWIGDPPSIV